MELLLSPPSESHAPFQEGMGGLNGPLDRIGSCEEGSEHKRARGAAGRAAAGN